MWDHEADVVVVGYGGAGATAALTAMQSGAQVLMIEKNPEGGGNTRYSGGTVRTYRDEELAIDHFEALCEGTTERSVIEAFVKESGRNRDWLSALGGELVSKGPSRSVTRGYPIAPTYSAFPTVRGAEGVGERVRIQSTGAAGVHLWGILSREVAAKKINVLYSSPVKELLVGKGTGVTGVIAESGGRDIRVRARRGVILTCGGFEYDQAMQRNNIGQPFFALCNPANTGDGIRLAGEIGADMWHMNAVATTFGYKFPEFEFGIRHSMPSAGYIYVDQDGKRFIDETSTDSHFMWSPTSYIDTKTLARTRMPSYVIFDEDTRMRGAIAETDHGKVSDYFQWSKDNSVEISKGWIKAGQTVGDLAAQINLRPDRLQGLISQYNLQCVGGYDPEFGRLPDTLVPIARPPYYAAEVWPCLFNTQGGPKRNAKAQVLDVRGNPIPRLYSAGELGSLWHRYYPGAGNVSEALAFGRIAGRNAAAEPPLAH